MYMYGKIISENKHITFLPKNITDDGSSFELIIRRKFLRSLIIPFFCAVGAIFCYKKIRNIENGNGNKNAIMANRNFKCGICSKLDSEYIVEPCHHLCLCYTCNKTAESCPICKNNIKNTTHIFLG